uniref:PPM-type phosphatase domain-containing protein n=1 Tax=Rhabditophanes sp. KR3021 TaxID=114890 RepID=A0AC35TR53_9BILA
MGAYLDKPVLEIEYDHGKNTEYNFVAASMQGWRNNQEDAHNAILNFDSNSHLFGVYDGHGGCEVSKYISLHFPAFLKESEKWKNGDIEGALSDCFTRFDDYLRQPDVLKELAAMSSRGEDEIIIQDSDKKHASEIEEEENTNMTISESDMKLEDVLSRYGVKINKSNGNLNGVILKHANALLAAKNLAPATEGNEECLTDINGGKKRPCSPNNDSNAKKIKFDENELRSNSSNDSDFNIDKDSVEEEDEDMLDEESDAEEEEEEFEDFALPTGPEVPGVDSGSTAVVVVIHNDDIFVANAGDSRALLCRNGAPVELSFDHKPEDIIEKTRIEAAGGYISADGRVNGGLNLSRALGDHAYKKNEEFTLEQQMITSKPDVIKEKLTAEDKFLIVACDGIWNSMTNTEVVQFIENLWETDSLKTICYKLLHNCIADSTDNDGTGCDNETIILIDLKGKQEVGDFSVDEKKSEE